MKKLFDNKMEQLSPPTRTAMGIGVTHEDPGLVLASGGWMDSGVSAIFEHHDGDDVYRPSSRIIIRLSKRSVKCLIQLWYTFHAALITLPAVLQQCVRASLGRWVTRCFVSPGEPAPTSWFFVTNRKVPNVTRGL